MTTHLAFDEFMAVYAEELARAVTERPQEYAFPSGHVPIVVGKMRAAFLAGSYNKEGLAIRRTCKRVGIKWTYAAMNSHFQHGRAL